MTAAAAGNSQWTQSEYWQPYKMCPQDISPARLLERRWQSCEVR